MSGRIRTVKPEWLDDERLALASSDARVLSIALILLADDFGNGRASLPLLAGRVFPGKILETLESALAELTGWFVELYSADGQQYFHIRNWTKHQKVDKPGKPRVPAPFGTVANPPEAPEKVRGALAPDLDLDLDLDHDQERRSDDRERAAQPAPAPAASAPEVNWDERETPCPLDLVDKLKATGVHVRLADALKVDVESVLEELREFVSYWTIGKGQGMRKRHWPAEARERVRRRAGEGLLKPPGAITHQTERGKSRVDAVVEQVLAEAGGRR